VSEQVPPLAPAEYQDTVRAALAEDIGAGDVTTSATVDAGQRAQAVLVAKTRCVLAGLDVAAEAVILEFAHHGLHARPGRLHLVEGLDGGEARCGARTGSGGGHEVRPYAARWP